MRSKILILAVAAATALATASLALAAMKNLGANLSGMGEHGIVNLQSHARQGRLCWTFQMSVKHVTAATVRDTHGMIVAHLGHMYRAKGCAMESKRALRMIENKPASYRVWVATAQHPGELRGKLFAGMAHM